MAFNGVWRCNLAIVRIVLYLSAYFRKVIAKCSMKCSENRIDTLKLFQKRNQCPPIIADVIFSIAFNLDLDYLCSTSDDRSAILWKLNRDERVQVYGHSSRMCRVTTVNFLMTGEDSVMNVWSFGGKLLKRMETHHGWPVCSLDCDGGWIAAGGSGFGVSMHPVGTECLDEALVLSDEEYAKLRWKGKT